MPGGAEWGLVAVTEDLMQQSRNLAKLAHDFRTEARAWTVPDARTALNEQAVQLTTWAQQAALESSRGDYWSRFEALQHALAQYTAGRLALREWWQRGELWNSHRMRAVPSSIGKVDHD